MKIAYVTADKNIPVFGPKGACVHIREMVDAFAALGHDVTLVTARRGEKPQPIAAEIVEVGYESAQPEETKPGAIGTSKARARDYRSLRTGAAVHDRLLELNDTQGFDLIYERYSLFSSTGVRAGRKLGIPCFVEVNSPLVREQQAFRQLGCLAEAEAVEAEVFRDADVLLTVSNEVRTYALSKGARTATTHVVPNGVDVKRFNPGVEPLQIAVAKDKFLLGFVGSLKPWHGIEALMDAFLSLAHRHPDHHLLIVGDGPLRGWIEGYARGAGLEDRVTVTGWVSHDCLPRLIKSMDIALAPYQAIDDFYFSPLKLYEYMAVGSAIVASRVGQVADVLCDGVTGLMAEPGNVQQLIDCVERLHGDDALRASLGAAAARSVGGRTWEYNARQVIEMASPAGDRRARSRP